MNVSQGAACRRIHTHTPGSTPPPYGAIRRLAHSGRARGRQADKNRFWTVLDYLHRLCHAPALSHLPVPSTCLPPPTQFPTLTPRVACWSGSYLPACCPLLYSNTLYCSTARARAFAPRHLHHHCCWARAGTFIPLRAGALMDVFSRIRHERMFGQHLTRIRHGFCNRIN